MKQNKLITYVVLGVLIFSIAMIWLLKHFNLNWVETTEDGAKVTINFLFPMEQNNLEEHLNITTNSTEPSQLSYSTKWITETVVEIYLTEQSTIKGQKVQLTINRAPTQFNNITKNVNIAIQFKTNVNIIEPTSERLISSTQPFVVQFNTPMESTQVHKYIQGNAQFYIKPYETVNSKGQKVTDYTRFIFEPKEALENNKRYVLLFKAGMPSVGGSILKQDYAIMLKVDVKPNIIKTYPETGDRWIGLYPCFTLESQEPIINAVATINGSVLSTTLVDSTHAYFTLDSLLQPESTYTIEFQTQVASGELSDIKQIEFTTTTLNNNRFWLDIHSSVEPTIICYEGAQKIRTIYYSIINKDYLPRYGTYYLLDKNDVYENSALQVGANYWMRINDSFGIHGIERNPYWQLNTASTKSTNLAISDEDASWLYEKITPQTMIIIRP